MESSGSFAVSSGEQEAQKSDITRKHGGWITFPFIIGNLAGMTLAIMGWTSNLIVYLIEEFNVKSIDAAQISNVVNGCTNLFPVIGAVIADSFLGSFPVVSICSSLALLGTILIALTAIVDSLRPHPCQNGSSFCVPPSKLQHAVLYLGISLASIGVGGTRFTTATMGANQFKNPKDQGVFFNWFFFTFYASSVVASTAIVYVEDNVSWGLGFGLCAAVNFAGLTIFLLGIRFYRYDKPQGSPFSGLARVLVAAVWKRRAKIPATNEGYYYGEAATPAKMADSTPTKSFRFLNKAAIRGDGDTRLDGSIAKPWQLCRVQEVEDLKALLKILPLWSTSIFLGTPIGILSSLTVLQALAMDRHLGPSFKIPAGSVMVVVLLSATLFLSILDRFLSPAWEKFTGRFPTPLQRIGVGHVLNILGIAVSAVVESQRLKIAHAHHSSEQSGSGGGSAGQMSVLWLFPQLILVGVGEAFHVPAQVGLYYQEFPVPLKSTATAMISLLIGISFYLGTALIDLIRRVTGWLPENINDGRLDNVYWIVGVAGVINFGYYLLCAKWYKYQSMGEDALGVRSNGDK